MLLLFVAADFIPPYLMLSTVLPSSTTSSTTSSVPLFWSSIFGNVDLIFGKGRSHFWKCFASIVGNKFFCPFPTMEATFPEMRSFFSKNEIYLSKNEINISRNEIFLFQKWDLPFQKWKYDLKEKKNTPALWYTQEI